jgi:hypothetical protein
MPLNVLCQPHCRSTRTQASHYLTTMTPFLFASPDGRRSSSSARRVHLRRLYDILHLSIQRGDLLLAQRSFAILARCEDVEWAAIWKFGLIVLAAADHHHHHHHSADRQQPGNDDDRPQLGTPKHVEFLRIMMLRLPEEVRSHLLFIFLWPRSLGEWGEGCVPVPKQTIGILSPQKCCLSTDHLSILTARIARARTGIVADYGWKGARRPR